MNKRQRAREFDQWLDRNRSKLVAIGLPPSVYLDESHWLDFLDHGHLHLHDDPWKFDFKQLNHGQLGAFYRFLSSEYATDDVATYLRNCVKNRLGIKDNPDEPSI